MILTVTVSLWCNYKSYCEWNKILSEVNRGHKNHVLEFKTDNVYEYNHILNFLSGFHLTGIPVDEDENNEINKVFSRYYKIKGIKVIRGN